MTKQPAVENMIGGEPMPDAFQGVTLWLGDGFPVTADDTMTKDDLREYISAPLQRAITAARLRALADMLTAYDAREELGMMPARTLLAGTGVTLQ